MAKQSSASVIDTVNELFKKSPLKLAFFKLVCQQMSKRTLRSLNANELHDFIHQLYDFFIVEHHQKSHIYLGKPVISSSTLTNAWILKMSHPDATHLFFTIEELLRKYRLKTTRRLHPLIGIIRNKKGEIIQIVEPSQSAERRSLVFIAFESLPHPSLLATIKRDLNYHMNCVQQSEIDAPAIQNELAQVVQQLTPLNPTVSSEWISLINWLNNHNFSFFGAHVIQHHGKKSVIETALGICNKKVKCTELTTPSPMVLEHTNNASFVMDRTTITSPIQRFEPLMKISFKFSNRQFIFYGILKRSSMYAKNMDTPLINKKMDYIFEKRRFLIGSYDYNEVIRIFNDIPKFELFRLSKTELLDMVDFIMSITNPNHIQCFKHYQPKTQQLKLYFVIPYYLFNATTVDIITNTICQRLEFSFFETISINAPEKCRLHMHFKLTTPPKGFNEEHIERTLTKQVQPWEDQVLQHLAENEPDILSHHPTIIQKIPSHYKVRTKPESAMRDIQRLLSLNAQHPIHFELFSFDYPPTSDLAGKVSMLLVYHENKLDLTNIMPILHNFGVHIVDQITSRFGDSTSTIGYILAFRILDSTRQKLNEAHIKHRLLASLTQVFQHVIPNDSLNKLILKTSLTGQDIFILQALRNYMYQIFQSSFSLSSINQSLIDHPLFCESFIQLFNTKFNPNLKKQSQNNQCNALNTTLTKYITGVQSVSDDQILRRMLSLVVACVRTNQHVKSPNDPLSFKFQSRLIFGIPNPVPYREIFVYDSQMEGVHIRFGPVARGGLRFSDRLDDYRTEVLGLVKTQQTKNAVIIPVGSKGGFVIKSNGVPHQQYERFITAMLQLTDNLVQGQHHTPKALVCYDDFDPYFVVAADKGTATFSDYANAISLERKFWLGDGFASGGKHGYDHKKVGITAKGAWECTKLHFKSLNKNPETDAITVVGIGDMGGDVFGNGMLLSQSIRLVAAFNHAHIFIDPSPNPSSSWKERQRLFKSPQSGWPHYKGISTGGGVFDRSAKSIPISPAMKSLFNIDATELSGEALIRAILCASVDLIWFGGIGTYIKSSQESHIDVGDPSNNNVRVNANQVNAQVIAEGANLAITQQGRIEYERQGGKINCDAIDNSAGVNMSDYEVNIKILLSSLANVVPSDARRNALLERATNDVTALVLQNNIVQHQLISMDQYRYTYQPYLIDHTINQLITLGRLNPTDEEIPSSKERKELTKEGVPLPRSVLAKCQAYAKMWIKDAITHSDYFSGPLYDHIFYTYFPKTIQKLMSPSKLPDHRLKNQCIATCLTNHFVGVYGCSSMELITISHHIPIDKAVHQLVILESVFDAPKKRKSMLENAEKTSDYTAISQFNQSCLNASLICHLLNIPLSQTKINHYQSFIKPLTSQHIPLSLLPLLFQHPSPKKCLQTLQQLNQALGIIDNICLLENLVVIRHVHHTQKTSLLIDLYSALNHALSLPPNVFTASPPDTLKPITVTQDTLSHLFLYSFHLRRHLHHHPLTSNTEP
jgi:glutamate dehydrogenase